MNEIQKQHILGTLNVYSPIDTYEEQWYHKGDVYYPIPGTRKPCKLPSIASQWRRDYAKRNKKNMGYSQETTDP